MNEVFVFLLAEHIEFNKDIDSPVCLKVMRKHKHAGISKTSFRALTSCNLADASKCVHFNSEFCIKAKFIQKPHENVFKKKIITINGQMLNPKKQKRETICTWKIDVANLSESDKGYLRSATIQMKHKKGIAILFFRIVILDKSNIQGEVPKSFFQFISNNINEPNYVDTSSTATSLTEIEDETTLIEGICDVKVVKTLQDDDIELGNLLNNFQTMPIKEPAPNETNDSQQEFRTMNPSDKKHKTQSKNEISLPLTPTGSDQYSGFLAPKPKKVHKKSSSSNSLPTNSEAKLNTKTTYCQKFDAVLAQHKELLIDLAINQCSPHFIDAVIFVFLTPLKQIRDMSDRLVEPLIQFAILTFSNITEEKLEKLVDPLFNGLDYTLSITHPKEELFALFSTTLNFGLKVSNVASLYTSAHLGILKRLSSYINQFIQVFSQILNASIANSITSDGFEFGDDESISQLDQETVMFLQHARAFQIPEQIIQIIVLESCQYFDVLLYNVIIDTADEFTDEKITSLLNKVRKIQVMFNCMACNFQAAFTNLLKFITTAKMLWSDVRLTEEYKNNTVRSIIERSNPPIQLPPNITLDQIGNIVETKTLRLPLPQIQFDFTYEWLYTQGEGESKWN